MKGLIFLLFTPLLIRAQQIAENKIDDFTHHKIVRTTWEPIIQKFGGRIIVHIRISEIDSTFFLDLKLMGMGVTSMQEGANLMLKTDTDSIITLHNLKYQLTCSGCGAVGISGSEAEGLDLSFVLQRGAREFLIAHKINKIRIYTTDGYEEEEVPDKRARVFINELKLVQ